MNDIVSQKNDEIDLIELIKVLWAKKVWIILSAFICTAITGVYAFTAKEQWTSKAEVIAPRTIDLGNYFALRKEYARILNQSFDNVVLEKNLFESFNLATESLNERKAFFAKSSYYNKISEGKSEIDKRTLLSNVITKNINVTKPDLKKDPNAIGRTISFSAETADEAQQSLQQFIEFANDTALSKELDTFSINLNEVIADLQYEKTKFETNLQIQKNVQLANLENALGIAKEAGLQNYAKSFSSANNSSAIQAIAMSEAKIPLSDSKLSDGSYLFMLGEKYLKAQIDVLKQNNVIYPPRYYEVSTLLSQLEPLLTKVKEVKANAFSYQASPDYPVVKDNGRKLPLLLISGMLGGLISIIFIILHILIQRYTLKIRKEQ